MICPKCNTRMTCADTYCSGIFTYRRIKCSVCDNTVYTKETIINEEVGKKKFAEKRDKYRKCEQMSQYSL